MEEDSVDPADIARFVAVYDPDSAAAPPAPAVGPTTLNAFTLHAIVAGHKS